MRTIIAILVIVILGVVAYTLIQSGGVQSPLFNTRDTSVQTGNGNPGGNGGSDPASTAVPQKYTLAGNTTQVPGQPALTEAPDWFVCDDGVSLMEEAADIGDKLPRIPIAASWQTTLVELSIPNPNGFGGLERFIFIVPTAGEVWEAHFREAATLHVYGFCGTVPEVQNWAFKQHVSSLQQASQFEGKRPVSSEIGIYVLNFENKTLTTVKQGLAGQGQRVLALLDISFHEGNVQDSPKVTLR